MNRSYSSDDHSGNRPAQGRPTRQPQGRARSRLRARNAVAFLHVGKEWDYSAFRQYVISHARKAGIAAKQADLARATEIDQTQLSRWFRGEAQPTVTNLRKLEAKVPGTTLHDMMILTGHVQADPGQLEPTPRQSHPLVYELDDLLADDSPIPVADRDILATMVDRILAPYRTGRRRTA